jgi:mRNA interferase RelE/StbE
MTENPEYQIRLTPLALEMLAEIKDQRHVKILSERIEKLKYEPEKQGKFLTGKLKGYLSIRAVGQRYRIIYQVQKNEIVVIVVGVGLRSQGNKQDIYSRLKKLL